MLDLNLSTLAAGFIFGTFGFFIFRFGQKHVRVPAMLNGLALMLFPYFIENPFLLWGIGAVLLGISFRLMR